MTNKEKKAIIAILNKNFTEEWVVTPVYTTNDGKEIELPQELCEIFNDIVVQAVIPYFADALITAGYGDTKATAKEAVADRTEEIFSWLYNNLVNANFVTGNAEISMVDLQNKAAEYGIDFFNNKGKLTVKEAEND